MAQALIVTIKKNYDKKKGDKDKPLTILQQNITNLYILATIESDLINVLEIAQD